MESIDPEKRIFRFFQSRLRPIMTIGWAIAVMIGGYLASEKSRQLGFIVEGVSAFLFLIVIYFLMNSVNDINNQISEKQSFSSVIKSSLLFVGRSKKILFLIVGFAINQLGFVLWSEILLFVVYFGYTGSDFGASMIRSFIGFIAIIIFIVVLGKITSNINKAWNFRFIMIAQIIIFFGGFLFLLEVIPLRNSYNIVAIIVMVVIFLFSITILNNINVILVQQLMLEIIPSNIRNSIYSLRSSLSSLMGVIMIPITTFIYFNFGITSALTVMFFTATFGLFLIFIASAVESPSSQAEIKGSPA